MNGLRLDLSLRQFDGNASLGATYRDEGLSVGADHMRLYGEEIELEVSYADLILGRRIGQGACSSVNLAQHRRTGEIYAVKLFNIYDRAQASQLYNEILLLTSFSCDALISLKGAFHDSGSIGVILEYMDRGSLDFLLDPAVHVTEPLMASISFQMIWGLGYLHHEKQIHRDIKPGNALMNSQGQVKLSDFGISKELDSTTAMSNSAVGSYMYMSPERVLGDKYDASADVWSVGLSIVQLWTKSYPFKRAETPVHLAGELDHFEVYSFSKNSVFSPHMCSFIRSTMAKQASDRSTCLELIRDCIWYQHFGLVDLESAQAIVQDWLQDYDRRRATPKVHPSALVNNAGPPLAAHGMQRSNLRITRSGVDLSQTLSSEDGMAMSASFSQTLRRPNPFTSSGSFSSSFMALQNQQQQQQQQQQHQQPPASHSFQHLPRATGRSTGHLPGGHHGYGHHASTSAYYPSNYQEDYSMQEEEEYDDDFEEVDVFDHRSLGPTRQEGKFQESKNGESKSYSRK